MFYAKCPNITAILKLVITFNEGISCTKFQSWNKICKMLPSLITEIPYNSRRDSGFRLCLRCVRHLVDPKYVGIRISNIEVAEIMSQNTKKMRLFGRAKC